MNKYTKRGFNNRADYLKHLSYSTGAPLKEVKALAKLLGKEKDFNELVTTIENEVVYYY